MSAVTGTMTVAGIPAVVPPPPPVDPRWVPTAPSVPTAEDPEVAPVAPTPTQVLIRSLRSQVESAHRGIRSLRLVVEEQRAELTQLRRELKVARQVIAGREVANLLAAGGHEGGEPR